MPPGAALWVGLLAVGTALGAAAGRPTALPGAASSAAGVWEGAVAYSSAARRPGRKPSTHFHRKGLDRKGLV